MPIRRTTITASPRPQQQDATEPADPGPPERSEQPQASKSSTRSSETGTDWQARTKPASSSSGSSA